MKIAAIVTIDGACVVVQTAVTANTNTRSEGQAMLKNQIVAAVSGAAMLALSAPAIAMPIVPDRPEVGSAPLVNVGCQPGLRTTGAHCYPRNRYTNKRYYNSDRYYNNKRYYNNGRRYYRGGNKYYYNNSGAAIVAGIAGLGLGLALAAPPRGYYQPDVIYQAPPQGVNRSAERIAYCARRYKTYNPDTGYYKPTVNTYKFCG